MEKSLKTKTIRGTFWSFADGILGQGVTFLVGIILARILTPEEYGIIGIILIFIAVFNSIVDSGFSNALIRKSNADDADYNTVFLLNLGLSVFLYFILFFSASIIADFFKLSELYLLLRVMGIIIILNALSIIQRTILIKNIDFKTQTKVSLIASISSGVIGISMAIGGVGVWSLVGQLISLQLFGTFFLWFFNKWRPSFIFSLKSFKELFSFSWKLLVSGLIDTLWKELYQVVIGKFYLPETLGQYTRAVQFKNIFSTNLTTVVQRVSFPVLSEIQDEKERLKYAYKKIIKITMFITFICMLGLAAIAKPLILVLIGNKWLVAASFLQIICFSGMLYPLHAINLNMLKVKGRSDLFLYLEVLKKIVAIGPLILGIFVGIYWMLWASVLTGFFSYYLNSYYSGRDLNYSCWEQLRDVFPSFSIAVITSVIVFLISFSSISPFYVLFLQLSFGLIIIVTLCEIFKLEEYMELKHIFLSLIMKVK